MHCPTAAERKKRRVSVTVGAPRSARSMIDSSVSPESRIHYKARVRAVHPLDATSLPVLRFSTTYGSAGGIPFCRRPAGRTSSTPALGPGSHPTGPDARSLSSWYFLQHDVSL